MRWWKPAVGVLIVLAIAVWDIGLPGKHNSPAGSAASSAQSQSPSPSAVVTPSDLSAIPGVILPEGTPEFAATFTGSKLNTSVWDTCYPWLSQTGCRNFGNAEESEWYLPSQDQVSGGLLHLVAQREPTAGTTPAGSPEEYDCRSGMITSYPSFRFKYGYVQIVASIPSSPGLWPALWLRPPGPAADWKPEMDMVESWGDGAFAGSYFHPYPGGRADKEIYKPPLQVAGWHIFALSWTRTQMTWLVDGKVTLTVRTKVPHQNMYILADLASYAPIGGVNQCKGQLLIRSIDVWKN